MSACSGSARTAASPAGSTPGADAALGDGADAVLLLNNDATVEPGFLEPLVDGGVRRGRRCRLRADPRQRHRSHLVRGRELRPPAWPPGSAHRIRRPAAPGGDRTVRDRPGLRRRDAGSPVPRSRRSAPSTRRSSRTRRTSTGRCAPGGPGSVSWSSRRASSTTACPRRRAARHRPTRCTTPAERPHRRRAVRGRGQARHAAPAGCGRGGVHRAGSTRPAPRRRPARGRGRTSRRPSRPARARGA